jgi:fatty acid synthase subunit beta
MDYENTFETIGEPDYTVELITDTDFGVLLSKDWFGWADESNR